MTEKERLEVLKHSYEVLQGLVKNLNEHIMNAKDGIAENNQNLLMGSLLGVQELADRMKNVYAVMEYLHSKGGNNA